MLWVYECRELGQSHTGKIQLLAIKSKLLSETCKPAHLPLANLDTLKLPCPYLTRPSSALLSSTNHWNPCCPKALPLATPP